MTPGRDDIEGDAGDRVPDRARSPPHKSGAADRYGGQYCATKASFTGDGARMPRTCPTRTHPDLTRDVSGYLDPARRELMRVADATPFTPAPERRLRNSAGRSPVTTLVVKDRALDHDPMRALRPPSP